MKVYYYFDPKISNDSILVQKEGNKWYAVKYVYEMEEEKTHIKNINFKYLSETEEELENKISKEYNLIYQKIKDLPKKYQIKLIKDLIHELAE